MNDGSMVYTHATWYAALALYGLQGWTFRPNTDGRMCQQWLHDIGEELRRPNAHAHTAVIWPTYVRSIAANERAVRTAYRLAGANAAVRVASAGAQW